MMSADDKIAGWAVRRPGKERPANHRHRNRDSGPGAVTCLGPGHRAACRDGGHVQSLNQLADSSIFQVVNSSTVVDTTSLRLHRRGEKWAIKYGDAGNIAKIRFNHA
jgi:hypothetical protein